MDDLRASHSFYTRRVNTIISEDSISDELRRENVTLWWYSETDAPTRNHRHKQLWMNSEECCLWLEVTSWFAQPGEFSERRFKISSHAHRERTSWEVRDCDKKEGIAGNRNTWGNMANTSPASVIAPSSRTVIIGVDDSCFSEYAFNCEYN